MTTITIERKLLEEVVEMFDNAISTRYPHEILRDIRATIAAPATAPSHTEAEVQELLHDDREMTEERFEISVRRILGVPAP